MIAYGFAHTAPDKVLVHLRNIGTPRSAIALIVGDSNFEQRKHLIFADVQSFEARRRSLLDSGSTCYVCDDPIALSSYNVVPVDYKAAEDFHVDGFTLLDFKAIPTGKAQAIRREPFDIVESAKRHARAQQTFFTTFMTFIYTMPKETHQLPVRQMACKWLASTETERQLANRIATLRKTVTLTEKQTARLFDLLQGDVVDLYRKGLQMEGDEDDVAMKLKISAYEMRYIRAINRGTAKRDEI